ncbi:hypothetical protein NDGK_02889 [Clostridiales bacterium CHKCI001]|nr:hypothetical protein NDGK_02889 [Clostridiales bacterium CHKCI001]
MKGKLKQIIAMSSIVLAITSIPFQYIWAKQDEKSGTDQSSISEQTIEKGIEYGSLIEKMEESRENETKKHEAEETLEEQTQESGDIGKQTSEDNQDKSTEKQSSPEETLTDRNTEKSSEIDEIKEEIKTSEITSSEQSSQNGIQESSSMEETSSEEQSKSESTSEVEQNNTNNSIVTLSEGDLLGAHAQINSVRRSKRSTGTLPFDSDDAAGNDSSAENNIIRSFDKISYEFELTLGIKEGSGLLRTYGGRIYAQAKLPTNLSATWHKDAFQWMENCEISADGKIITGYYKIDDLIQSAPGSQTLNFEIDVNGCANNTEIIPEFLFYLEGNETSEYKQYKDDPIRVSAIPRYNVQLEWDRGTSAYKGIEVELDGERSKLYTVGFGFQLYGESPEKGLKGIEIPDGDLTFDVDVSLIKKAHQEDISGEDVTNGNVKFLTAKPNTKEIWEEDLTDASYKQLLDEIGEYSKYSTHLPLSSGNKVFASDNRSQQVYHNGQISVEQDGNTLHVRISNYAIDGIFPYRWASSSNETEHNFTDQIGYICTGNLFYAVVLNDQTFASENSNCYLSFEAKNMSVKSIGGTNCQEDKNATDQKLSTMHVEYKDGKMATGNYSYTLDLSDKTKSGKRLQSTFENGDGRTMAGANIALVTEVALDASNPLTHAGYAMNLLCKIDDECYEPIIYQDGSEYAFFNQWNNYSDEIKFNVLYAAKKDKTGWNSDEEMAEMPMQDLIYFDTIQELEQDGFVCVGVMYESISGVLKPGSTARVRVPVHIKQTSVVDQVYQFIGNVRIWGIDNQLDRSKQTFLNPDATYPTTAFAWKPTYTKTKYDGNGIIIGGHDPGHKHGNSMIIVGGLTSITKSVSDKTAQGETKTVYDLRNMERIISYILYPSFVSSAEIEEEISVKDDVIIEDILPKGLNYIEGSSNYKNPDIETLEDGSTKLKWVIKDWEINTGKDPITYKVEINPTSMNGTQYKNRAMIHAPNVDNSAEVFRSDSYSITIINLAGHRIFKEALKDIIQIDGIVEYKINYLNMTEQKVKNVAILDILPYNEDGRMTAYHGSYKVSSLYPENIKDGTNYEIYGTNDIAVRNKNVGEIDIKDGTWELIGTKADEIRVEKELTAIYIKGDFESYEEFTMRLCLDPENCSGGDWYYNDFTVKTGDESDIIQAVPVGIQVMEQKITVTKKIRAEEYYKPFGNPFFCFCLEGELENGEHYKLYQSVEFTEEYIKDHTSDDGTVQISVEFNDLEPGVYRLSEQKIWRYYLESIDEISDNGTLEGDSVVFQMDTGKAGSAVFVNRMKRWDKLTHAVSVINEIKKKN